MLWLVSCLQKSKIVVYWNIQREDVCFFVMTRNGYVQTLLSYCDINADVEDTLAARFGFEERALLAPSAELCAVDGMSVNAAVLFGLVAEMRRRVKVSAPLPNCKDNSDEVALYFRCWFSSDTIEKACALFVDGFGNGKKMLRLGDGSLNCSPFEINNMIKEALPAGGDKAIIIHSHTKPNAKLSLDDIITTKSSAEQLDSVGVSLKRHCVYADD